MASNAILFHGLNLIKPLAFFIGKFVSRDLHTGFVVTGSDISERGFLLPDSLHPLHRRNPVITAVDKGSGNKGTNYTLNKNGQMLGANGVQVPSKTIWKGQGKERIDVENPNPGQRAGQLHYQDNQGNKYYYDPVSQTFPDAPKKVNNLLKDDGFKKAIDKGMSQYLGEK